MATLRSVFVLVALVAVVGAGASCAAPAQNGGIVIMPHPEARLDLMCRYRTSDAQHCVEAPEE